MGEWPLDAPHCVPTMGEWLLDAPHGPTPMGEWLLDAPHGPSPLRWYTQVYLRVYLSQCVPQGVPLLVCTPPGVYLSGGYPWCIPLRWVSLVYNPLIYASQGV